MKTDQLNRRLRFAPPNPVQERIVITERDIAIFEAINRHGPLPAHYLFELTKHLARSYKHLQYRLTELYNGDSTGTYLTRPVRQFDGYKAHYQHLVYGLSPLAENVLQVRGTLSPHAPNTADPFIHQLMAACVGASIELAAQKQGVRYISRHEILTHPRIGEAREAVNPMRIPLSVAMVGKSLVPDDLFGLEYPEGFRFFAVEVDRGTESIERRNTEQTAFGRKIAGYHDILKRKAFTSWWGIPNLHVLTVTVYHDRIKNIIEHIKKSTESKYVDRFAFAVAEDFGVPWRVPLKTLEYLFTDPWTIASGTREISKA